MDDPMHAPRNDPETIPERRPQPKGADRIREITSAIGCSTAFLENGTVSTYLGSGTHSDRGPPMVIPFTARTTRNTLKQSTRPGRPSDGQALEVRFEVHSIGDEAGRALSAAQGRVLRRLLRIVAEMEVGQADRPDAEEEVR